MDGLNAAASSAIGAPMKTLSKNAKAATTVLTSPERAALVDVGGAAIPHVSAATPGAGAALVRNLGTIAPD